MGKFQQVPQIYSTVFEALDASLAVQAALASSEASIQRALTEFRTNCGDAEALERLETISIGLQQMGVAALRGCAEERSRSRQRLATLAAEWMQRLPMH